MGGAWGYQSIVLVAVLLENFSIFYNDDDTEVNHALVGDFKQNWLFYDKNASVRNTYLTSLH